MSDKAPKILLVEDDVGLQKQIKWSLDEYEVLATGDRLSHKHAAPAAAKGLIFVPPHGRPERRFDPALARLPAMRPDINR